jgi:polar amino acid transport system substrate-binding protein
MSKQFYWGNWVSHPTLYFMNQKGIKFMQRKNFQVLVSFIILLFFNLAFAKNEIQKNYSAATSDISKILAQKKIIVAIPKDDEEVLFYHDKNNQLTGFMIEMAQDIGKELGVTVEFNREATNYEQLVDLVAQNKVDAVICDLSKTLLRGKKILYTDTFASFHQTLFINRVWLAAQQRNPLSQEDPLSLLNKKDCRIGALAGTSYVEFAQKLFPNAHLQTYQTWQELSKALLKDQLDVLFIESFTVRKMLMDKPGLPLKYKALLLKNYPDLIAMGVPKNSPELWHWLNLYLEIKNIRLTSSDILADYAKKNP